MTATPTSTDISRPPTPASPAPAQGGAIQSFGRGFMSEWTKIWSVRSTWRCLATGLVLTATWAGIVGFDYSYEDTDKPAPTDPYPVGDTATAGIQFGQFATFALAMLVVTAEYSTGSIRSTLQSGPQRGRVLLSKAAVVGLVLFLAGIVLALAGVGAGAWLLGDYAQADGAELTRQVLSIAGYVSLTGLLTLGIGFAVRSAVGTLSLAFVLLVLLRLVLGGITVDFFDTIADYLPSSAGLSLLEGGNEDRYGRGVGAIVLAAWAGLSLMIGYVALRRRDA